MFYLNIRSNFQIMVARNMKSIDYLFQRLIFAVLNKFLITETEEVNEL